jgi:cytochrome P450
MTASAASRLRCPIAHGEEFDPRSVAAAGDPEPWFSLARDQVPVFYVPELDVWYVTRYADILAVVQDTASYSSRHSNKFKPMSSDLLRSVYPNGHPGLHSMLLKDPPEHSRIRRLANRAFTPRLVSALEPTIRRRCDELIADFVADGDCDVLSQFSARLPVKVMTDLAGVSDDVDLDFAAWGVDYFALVEGAPDLSDTQERELVERAQRMLRWLNDFVEQRRSSPQEDLISALVHARSPEGDPALSTAEVIAVLSSMMSAGIETTSVFIPELLWYLLSHQTLWAEVVADPNARARAVEEGLRYFAPARGIRRTTTKPVTLGNVDLPAGVDVFLSWKSANFDQQVFADATAFDLHRPNADRHLSFGRGTHFCIGAPLARLEIRVALDALIEALPGLRLAADTELQWTPNMVIPRPQGLRLAWDPTTAAVR